ncbi:MAG: M48 family metallopeptidase [Terracidiphilus sp.]|jgi:Zn-dependent protease with chaperone function
MSFTRGRLLASRPAFLLSILLLTVPPAFHAAAQSTPAAPEPPAQSRDAQPITQPATPSNQPAYSLPPAKLAKAIALSRIRNILDIVGSLWSLAVLWLLLATRAAAKLEGWTHQLSSRCWLQGTAFFAIFLVLLTLADLPLDIYAHHVSLAYGIGIEGWGPWFGDLAKSLALSLLVGAPVLLLFNWIVSRWPRRYWLIAWIVSLPLMLLGAFVLPLLAPLYNKYEPLARNHPALVVELEKVVARTGTHIPPGRIFLVKASAKTNGLNAYVAGLGATKRFVMWDTTVDRLPNDEIMFVFAHESGHYVLNHIPQGLAVTAVALFFVFWACARIAAWLARRCGPSWGIAAPELAMEPCAPSIAQSHRAMGGSPTPISTRTGFVVLLFVVSVAGFLFEPADNAVSRHFEHQADVYGQEAIHGLVPDPQKTAVAEFHDLGEAWLDDPNPSPFIEFWLYNHPSTQSRANFAAHYNPWANGGHGQFFDK